MAQKPLANREVILEYFKVGTYTKVTAMDVKTLTEVTIQGPSNAGQAILEYNALKRLEFVLKKNGVIQ
jgi:hypothetical protein